MSSLRDFWNQLLTAGWTPSRRTEITAGMIAAAVSIVLFALQSRDLWFFSDVWPILTTRSLTSVGSLMRDHGGHWTLPQNVLILGLYHLFGLVYWPWFILPRLVVYTGLCFALWRIFRWRQVDPLLAFGAYLVLLFLGPSAWQTNVAHIGVLLIECYLLACAVLIAQVEQPSAKHRWALFSLLTLALATFGSGAAVWAGVTISLFLYRKTRLWWPAIAGSAAIYVIWYVNFGTRQSATLMKPSIPSIEAIFDAPGRAIQLLSASIEPFLLLSEGLSTFVLGGFCVWILALAIRKQLHIFDTIFFLTTLGFAALVVLIRTPTGVTTVRAPSYTFAALLFLLPPAATLLLSKVTQKWRIPVFLVLITLALFNAQELLRVLEQRQEGRRTTRPRVEAAAWMTARGEPFVEYARVDYQIVARHVQRLVNDGWQVSRPLDETVTVATRGLLRMSSNASALQGQRMKVQKAVHEGCVTVAPGEELIGEVSGLGSIQLSNVSGVKLWLRWTDEYGLGEQEVTAARDEQFIMFAQPNSRAEVKLSGTWNAPITVCGVES